MLRMTLEIVPFGIEDRAREIGRIVVGNISATGLGEYGDYTIEVFSDTRDPKFPRHQTYKFREWPRQLGAFRLMQYILRMILGPTEKIAFSSTRNAKFAGKEHQCESNPSQST